MKCIVIGGGFAGLTAASYLTNANIEVILLEASPKLGGRAYSFRPSENEETIVDNGQHILMSCYKETLGFLDLINSKDLLEIQKKLKVIFVNRNSRQYNLEVKSDFYPFNIISALIRFGALSFSDRLKIMAVFEKLIFINENNLKTLSVKDWLKKNRQSKSSQKTFWEILTVGTLNTSPAKASAYQFVKVLKEIFLSGNDSTKIAIPKTGLSEMYCEKSSEFIKSRNGEINLSERVTEFKIEENRITKICTSENLYEDFDFVISAVPVYALEKIVDSGIQLPSLEYSSIMSVHLWLKSNPFTENFYGLIDSDVHWLFNHNDHITLVTSNADRFLNEEKSNLLSHIYSELEKYFPIFYKDLVQKSKIIFEKRATFIPSVNSVDERKKTSTSIKNLVLAGDWTNTNFPSTIESAVKSGKTAAEYVILNST